MCKPNFFVIGAGRSGTTSLYNYLKQHPDVFMSPIKETNFFAYEGENMEFRSVMRFPVVTTEAYLALYHGVSKEKAVGEASPLYLHSRYAAERIREFCPEAKLIAILRHPVDRAHSSFHLHLRDGDEKRTFAEAVRREREGIEDASLTFGQRNYLRFGRYSRYLSIYFELFEREQIEVYLFDDLAANPLTLMRNVFGFLEVDATFAPDVSLRHNAAGVPESRFWQLLVTKNSFTRMLRKLLPVRAHNSALEIQAAARSRHFAKPKLSEELRHELNKFYRDDILKLQDLIQRDLSPWLK
jgi:hypothetical protein